MKIVICITLILISLLPLHACDNGGVSSSTESITYVIETAKFDYEYTMHVGESKRFSILWNETDLEEIDEFTQGRMKNLENVSFDHAIGTNTNKVSLEILHGTYFSTVTIEETFSEPIEITGLVFNVLGSVHHVQLNGNLTIHNDENYQEETPLFPVSYFDKLNDVEGKHAMEYTNKDNTFSFLIRLSDIGIQNVEDLNQLTIQSLQFSENEYCQLSNIQYAILKTEEDMSPESYRNDLVSLPENGVTMSYASTPMGIIFEFTIEILKTRENYNGFGRDIEFYVISNNVNSILYREIILP